MPLRFNKFVYVVFSKYDANAESLFPREFSEFNGELRQKVNAIVHNLNILMLLCGSARINGMRSPVWASPGLGFYRPLRISACVFLRINAECACCLAVRISGVFLRIVAGYVF